MIGGGDWASDRLIPDLVRSFTSGTPPMIRNPSFTRPWQHVLDALNGYIVLAEHLSVTPNAHSGAWNFGPEASYSPVSVETIVKKSLAHWEMGEVSYHVQPDQEKLEAHTLNLDSSKAENILNWKPVWDVHRAIEETLDWYYQRSQGIGAEELCLNQIVAFFNEKALLND